MTDVSTTEAPAIKKPRKPRAKSTLATKLAKMSDAKFTKFLAEKNEEVPAIKAECARRNAPKAFVYNAASDA